MNGVNPLRVSSPTLHLTILIFLFAFVISLFMAYFLEIEIVARGVGRIVPVNRVQVVQSEYSGSIIAIYIRDGSEVEKGDVLLELDATGAKTNLRSIVAEWDRLIVEKARIDAFSEVLVAQPDDDEIVEAALGKFRVPDSVRNSYLLSQERSLLQAEVEDLLASINRLDAREESFRSSERVTKSNIARVNSSLRFQATRLESFSSLLSQGVASESDFLVIQQEYADLEQQKNTYNRELDQKVSERLALNAERHQLLTQALSAALTRKAAIGGRLATLSEERLAAIRRVQLATLRAPATGTVDRLQVFTIGGIAEAESELMRIVPSNVKIEIEAHFSNQDIGFMSVGQRANVRLDAYPSERFGFVKGQVTDLAADSIEEPAGQWGYRVRVSPDSPVLLVGIDTFFLKPGMTATVDVTTGTRKLISYFFAPILRTLNNALGER